MFANSYSPFGYFDSYPHHQHHHTRLSPGGASSSSYEERKRREDAHRRRRIEAERSRRRRCNGLLLSTSHSSPALLGVEYDYPPQSQSQPNLRFEEEVDDNNDARKPRQKGTVLQSCPQLDDNEGNTGRRCLELVLPPQSRNDEERSYINNFTEGEDQLDVDEGNAMAFLFSDSPPSFIYASISMSQDEMNGDNNNIATTTSTTTTTTTTTTTSTSTSTSTTTTTITSSRAAAPRKTGSMDSYFFTHMNTYEKPNKYFSVKDMDRKKEEQGADTMEVNNEEEDAASCPPHIIAEEVNEDASDDDEIDAYDIAGWRGSSIE